MNFFSSDEHFGRDDILELQKNRKFDHITDMEYALIAAWNSVVTADDTTYCLGDVSHKRELIQKFLPLLNGKKILIFGNHDPYFRGYVHGGEQGKADAVKKAIDDGFSDAMIECIVNINNIPVKLSHFPYWEESRKSPEAALLFKDLRPKQTIEKTLLHGHVHDCWSTKKIDGSSLMINVGVDCWNLSPISADHVFEIIKNAKE